MTTAEFIAACFWPFMAIAAFALLKARKTAAFPFVVNVVSVSVAAYVVLGVAYDRSSIIAVNDVHVGLVLLGLAIAGSHLRRPAPEGPIRAKAKALASMILIVLLGSWMAWYAGRMLFLDFMTDRLVIEGRVVRAERSSGRRADYLVTVAGRTVKVTTPIYERLQKFRPAVRLDVGRGSNYVYEIEYLAN